MKKPFWALFLATTLLSSCSGGSSSGPANPLPQVSPTTSPIPTSTPSGSPIVSTTSMKLAEGFAVPSTKGSQPFGDGDATGGGQGNAIGGISCVSNPSAAYHMHVHLSILNGNSQVYVPQAIGIVGAIAQTGTFPNTYTDTGTCVYSLHTHDHSGIIHVEAATQPATPFMLGQFFAIWGQSLSATNVGSLVGDVHVYVTKTAPDAAALAQPTLQPTEWLSPLTAVPLVDRQEITIVINPSSLPLPRFTWPGDLQ